MAIRLCFDHPTDGRRVDRELVCEDEPFTVGRAEDCNVSISLPELSRYALAIEARDVTRVLIMGGQRYGYVQVTRDDGARKATLGLDEEFACGAGAYRVALKTKTAEVLAISVTVDERPRIVAPGALTVGLWSRRQIWEPTPEDDWRWVAALVTVVAQTNTRHKGKALEHLAKAWHDGDFHANVQLKLDKVLKNLGVRDPGNKQEAIASEVLNSGFIQHVDYLAFRDEVQRRALNHLSRENFALLQWGYRARGA